MTYFEFTKKFPNENAAIAYVSKNRKDNGHSNNDKDDGNRPKRGHGSSNVLVISMKERNTRENAVVTHYNDENKRLNGEAIAFHSQKRYASRTRLSSRPRSTFGSTTRTTRKRSRSLSILQ